MGRIFWLIIILLLLVVVSSFDDYGQTNNSRAYSGTPQLTSSLADHTNIHFPLHHINGPGSPIKLPARVNITHLILKDEARHKYMTAKMLGRSTKELSTATAPIENGITMYSIAEFIANIKFGTPSEDFPLIIDTGSGLVWMQCQPCTKHCHTQAVPIFDPTKSSTYKSISCNDRSCGDQDLSNSRCSSNNTCVYNITYLDQSYSKGILSKESLNFGSAVLEDFVFGCTDDNQGTFDRTKIAGIAGLSNQTYSLAWQFGLKYGYVFSYCLPMKKDTGFLTFGQTGYNSSKYSFTPLLPINAPQFYITQLNGIALNQQPLLPSSFPLLMIIDSGTTITLLPTSIYASLRNAFVQSMTKYTRVSGVPNLDTCFLVGSSDTISVPDVTFNFDGLGLKLEVWNLVIEVPDGIYCLAFRSFAASYGIFGNTQQLNMTVVYDVARSRIGFAPGCVWNVSSSSNSTYSNNSTSNQNNQPPPPPPKYSTTTPFPGSNRSQAPSSLTQLYSNIFSSFILSLVSFLFILFQSFPM